MFWPRAVLAKSFCDHLAETFLQRFSDEARAALISEVAADAIGRIQRSSCLYHDAEHTMLVTLAGQEILLGRMTAGGVEADDWVHMLLALLLHDIGFVAGACRGDGGETGRRRVIDADGGAIELAPGATDAALQPHHVARSIIHVRERYASHPLVDAERLVRAIGYTRFPVPEDPAYAENAGEPGLVRAADLIGQLADPNYFRKNAALFAELSECGLAKAGGYRSPADILTCYPAFYRSSVEPHLGAARYLLGRTEEGRQWLARLDGHVAAAEAHADAT